MPLVDVIIPTRNRFELTRAAIESVQDQTFQDWNLWVMDDASDDGSAEGLHDIFKDDERIQIILSKKLGPVRQRQKALDLADAPWIAMLDSDDLWLPEKLSKQLARASDVDLVLTWYEWFREDGAVRKTGELELTSPISPLLTNNMSLPLISRQWLESVGGFWSPEMGEPLLTCDNTELYLRLAPNARVAVVPEILTRCRDHAGPRSSDANQLSRGASEMTRMIEAHGETLAYWPEERASLLAQAGARHLAAENFMIGFRMMLTAAHQADWRGRRQFTLKFGPFLLKTVAALPAALARRIMSRGEEDR